MGQSQPRHPKRISRTRDKKGTTTKIIARMRKENRHNLKTMGNEKKYITKQRNWRKNETGRTSHRHTLSTQ